MPIVGKDEKLNIEILKGIELVAIECLRNMIEIIELPSKDTTYRSKWKVFTVKYDSDAQRVPVYDDTGYMTKAHSVYALKHIKDKGWISNWLNGVPDDVKNRLKKIVKEHGLNEDALAESLAKVLMTPIPRLKNPEDIAKMNKEDRREDWGEFIESVISPGAEKDHRLILTFKTHLLRGNIQRYNPHTLLITNSGVGKSTYYDMVGLRIDKASASRLIGYSDAQKPYPGIVDNLYTSLCIEQIESQTAPEILAFLLSFMELGQARSETGAGGFTVRGTCPIIITANPTGYNLSRIDTFRALIDRLTGNLVALGRRFGIIIYGMDYGNVIVKKTFSSVEWQNNVQKFRSIEEYALPLIKSLYKDKEVSKWLEKLLPDYKKRGKKLIENIVDEGVKDFLTTHFELAYPHIRGSALNCAIIDFIPRLVKVKMTCKEDDLLVWELLVKAEKYLKDIIAINLESVANMVHLEEEIRDKIFELLPKRLQELFWTLKNYTAKVREEQPKEILIDKLQNYIPKESSLGYVSQIVNYLDNITPETINDHNIRLEKYWGFRIIRKERHIYTIEFVR